MARREAPLAWWAGIGVLGGCAAYVGTWQLWALTVLTWSLYELCLCPTTCGVATRDGGRPCHRAARGRVFACADVEGHQQVKTDALWRLNTLRPRATYGDGGGVAPAHRKARLAPPGHGSVEPRHRLLAYAAVVSVLVTTVQAALALTAL